ncbi:MAG: tail fiber domain-containing protein, partial [Chromatiales bacterium]|nr:tail fiber domain-containing protein [Chromatiales bacterium]
MGNGSAPGWEPDSTDLTALGNSNYRFSDVVSETVTTTATSGNSLSWTLAADAAEDNGDSWQVSVADGGALSFSNDISGSQVAKLALSSSGDMRLAGDVYFNSDANLKQDIQPISNALQKVSAVAAKRYRFTREMDDSEPAHLGVLAQELEQTLPELINEGDDGIKSVNYIALAPLLTSAMNELAMDNRQRRKQLQVLKARKSSLLKALEQFEREGK